jgi:hypothetical protein
LSDIDIPLDTQSLAKFIEVHEFFFKMDTDKMNKIINASTNGQFFQSSSETTTTAADQIGVVTTMPMSVYDINGSLDQYGHLTYFFIDKTALIILCIDITTFDESMGSDVEKAEERLKLWLDMILFKMSKTCNFYLLPVATKCDLYISSTRINSSRKPSAKENKAKLVLDDSDLWYENVDVFTKNTKIKLKNITDNILNKIHQHFDTRLGFVKTELEKIENLTKISASQSDRLKNLAALYTYCKPGIHQQIPIVSSVTMHGMQSFNEIIRSIVCNNEKFFPNVNKKIPTLWIEVEKYVFSRLNRIPMTRFADDSVRYSPSHSLSSISGLCIDFEEYKEKITEKYGMEHMIFEITNYLNSQGKVMWLQDSESWCTKVFLKPNMLFDLLHALYRKDFDENFTDNHLQVIRTKLSINTNMSDDFIEHLKQELLSKGCAHIDLLKLIWLPIVLSDSLELLNDLIILLMAFFNIGYPQIPKSKMKKVFENFSVLLETPAFKNRSVNRTCSASAFLANRRAHSYSAKQDALLRSQSKMSNNEEQFTARSNNTITAFLDSDLQPLIVDNNKFDCIMVPFYMPLLNNEEKLNEIRNVLRTSAATVGAAVLNSNGGKLLLPRVCIKYSFPWGMMAGLFERFTVNCIINTELYYKMHWKDAVYAYNEQNTIG